MFPRLGRKIAPGISMFVILSSRLWGVCPAATDTISICNLFRVLSACNGKIVTVRGVLLSSREFVALADPNCPHGFVTEADGRRVTWPVELDLRSPGAELGGEASRRASAEFEVLPIPFRVLREHGVTIEVEATITGRLDVKEVYRHVNFHQGRPHGAGFGHLGLFPGRLVIHSVREFSVVFRDEP
jgi:hypothetical protein